MLLGIRRSISGKRGKKSLYQQYMQIKYHAFLTVHRNRKISRTALVLQFDFSLFTKPVHTSWRSAYIWFQILYHSKATPPVGWWHQSHELQDKCQRSEKPSTQDFQKPWPGHSAVWGGWCHCLSLLLQGEEKNCGVISNLLSYFL